MSSPTPVNVATDLPEGDRESRLLVHAAMVGFGLMFVASGLLWAGYGPTIFQDVLSFASACF
jgi:hypothetical protein